MEYKLGKLPPKKDERTLKLNKFLKALPPIPDEWDYDSSHKVPTPMFANDKLGDCVIAGRGHQTLRFELTEQGKVISISDKDVTQEYFKETLGRDCGLSVLDSLKLWRKEGWNADTKTYDIYAFASVYPKDHQMIAAAIYLLTGIGIGLSLPQSAMDQFNKGQMWDIPSWWNFWGKQIIGGHYVYVSGFNKVGPVGVTWGRKQQMTWKFFHRYCDEAFAIVDNKDKWLSKSLIDIELLENYLNQVCL